MASDPRYIVFDRLDFEAFQEGLAVTDSVPSEADVVVVAPSSPDSLEGAITPDIHAAIEMIAVELSAVNSDTLQPGDIYASLYMSFDTLKATMDQALQCIMFCQEPGDPAAMILLASRSQISTAWLSRNHERIHATLETGHDIFRSRVEERKY